MSSPLKVRDIALVAILAQGLFAGSGQAAQPVTIQDPTNTNYANVDSNHDLHVVCDQSSCSGGGGGGGAITGPLGTQTLANSVAVTSADCVLVTIGCEADTAWGLTGSASAISILKAIAINSANPIAPNTGTPTQTSVSCGTGSTTLLAASAATKFVTIKVPASAANPVWINVAGAAAVTAAPSFDMAAGSSLSWVGSTGYLPTSAMTCIGTGAVTVTLIYQ